MATPYGYARTYQAQAVLTASPGQLVLMLYDGALRFLNLSIEALNRPESDLRRVEQAHVNLQKAHAIIAELRSNLNFEAGGDHARNLDRLYDYYLRRLVQANLKKDPAPAVEVERLVRSLRDGWAEMLRMDEAVHFEANRGVA